MGGTPDSPWSHPVRQWPHARNTRTTTAPHTRGWFLRDRSDCGPVVNTWVLAVLAGAGGFLFLTEIVIRRRLDIPIDGCETAVSGILGGVGYALREAGGQLGLAVFYV